MTALYSSQERAPSSHERGPERTHLPGPPPRPERCASLLDSSTRQRCFLQEEGRGVVYKDQFLSAQLSFSQLTDCRHDLHVMDKAQERLLWHEASKSATGIETGPLAVPEQDPQMALMQGLQHVIQSLVQVPTPLQVRAQHQQRHSILG